MLSVHAVVQYLMTMAVSWKSKLRSITMRIRKLDRVSEGSVLYSDAVDESGKCILQRGSIITKDRLKILSDSGISVVSVCTQDSEITDSSISLSSAKKIMNNIMFADSYTGLLIQRNGLEYMQDDSILTRHNKNVANLVAMCIDSNKVSLDYRRSVVRGAVLHDMGKMGIPERILNKTGKLTPDEYEYIKLHPVLGVGYLMHMREKVSQTELNIVEQHHENYDGSGYPYGLKGDEIDKNAALVHIIDVFEARTAKRTYKKHEDRFAVISDMEKYVGTMFDPDAFNLFRKSVPLYFVGERVVTDNNYIYIVIGHTSTLEPIIHDVVRDRERLLSEVVKNHKCYVDDLRINGIKGYEPLHS